MTVIDTVAVTVIAPDFTVVAPGMFGPKRIFPDGGWQRSQNSTARERAANVKRPTVTWSGGAPGRPNERLRVEGSLPKLVLGNNLDELADEDAEVVLRTLSNVLADMGVDVAEETLWQAKVSALHVGKNVLLSPDMTCSTALMELASHPQRATWDQTQSSFRNGGDGFKLHTDSRETTFYDKLADVRRAMKRPKRAIDPQSGVLGVPSGVRPVCGDQVLRMECRFNTRPSVKDAMAWMEPPILDPRLRDVFNAEVAMKVLLRELERFEGPPSGAATVGLAPLDTLSAYMREGMTLRAALAAHGLQDLEKVYGSAAVRRTAEAHGVSAPAWYRLKNLRRVAPTGGSVSAVQVIKAALVTYSPMRLMPEEAP